VNDLINQIKWIDPISGKDLEPIITARNPSGTPLMGALKISGTDTGYPIVDSVVRMTPELANKYSYWLDAMGLKPPESPDNGQDGFQTEDTVDSFSWQWHWAGVMRTSADLKMRVDGYGLTVEDYLNKVILDAGAGAGDQSKYLLDNGGIVVSIDLSNAINLTATKLRLYKNWLGIQGDITNLPFKNEQFNLVYCEGVIQHTQDSMRTVQELMRVIRKDGKVAASHYTNDIRHKGLMGMLRKAQLRYHRWLRSHLSKMNRYKLQLLTGVIAALNYIPVINFFLRKTKTVEYYNTMPDFRTTWINTFDSFGNHSYQRNISSEEFLSYFKAANEVVIEENPKGYLITKK
jgi:SAM-dependent methyltransferase